MQLSFLGMKAMKQKSSKPESWWLVTMAVKADCRESAAAMVSIPMLQVFPDRSWEYHSCKKLRKEAPDGGTGAQ